jgi:hypothetical protein
MCLVAVLASRLLPHSARGCARHGCQVCSLRVNEAAAQEAQRRALSITPGIWRNGFGWGCWGTSAALRQASPIEDRSMVAVAGFLPSTLSVSSRRLFLACCYVLPVIRLAGTQSTSSACAQVRVGCLDDLLNANCTFFGLLPLLLLLRPASTGRLCHGCAGWRAGSRCHHTT